MAANEINAPVREVVLSLIEDVTLRHEPNQDNVRNNRGFALYKGKVVEIVRRGPKKTRVRENLDGNTDTILVASVDLEGYTHPVQSPLI